MAWRVRCPSCALSNPVAPLEAESKAVCGGCGKTFRVQLPRPAGFRAAGVVTASAVAAKLTSHVDVSKHEPSLDQSPTTRKESQEKPPVLSLRGLRLAWADRWLPTRPVLFLLVAFTLTAAIWGAGYLAAPDTEAFLQSADWHATPLFMFVHLVALRLFITSYVRNFESGLTYLDLGSHDPNRTMRVLLGPLGLLLAVVVAAPFCLQDFFYLYSEKNEPNRLGEEGVGAVDLLLWCIWSIEWFLNANIWVLLLGFLGLTMRTFVGAGFRDPVEVVLHQRQYRPFLLMSAQGASIVLGFGGVTAAYVWYVDGSIADYIGLGLTVVLLLIGFVPPWLQLKKRLETATRAEIFALRERLITDLAERRARPLDPAVCTQASFTMLRIGFLENLQTDFGKNEAKAVLLKLMAPAGTMAWKVLRPLVLSA